MKADVVRYPRLPRRRASGDRQGSIVRMVEKVGSRRPGRVAHEKNLVKFALGVRVDWAGQPHWLAEKVGAGKEKENE